MLQSIVLTMFACLFSFSNKSINFLSDQKQHSKVKEAFIEKENDVITTLMEHNIKINKVEILLVVLKAEKTLILYAKNRFESSYQEVEKYKICYASGQLGPKRREGDLQVAEGFYNINVFNPHSSYYLSLGINYPNRSDLIKTTVIQPGGNIYIHGNCVSIGCIAMEGEIKEIYVYAVHAKNNGQHNIPVYIFPFEMIAIKTYIYKQHYATNPTVINFWNNVWQGYMNFSNDKMELKYSVNSKGDYIFE